MSGNLYESFRARWEEHDHRTFLRVPGGPTRTYGEMVARAARFAGALDVCGVRPGDRVLVQVDKSADAVALYLACLRAGAVLLPLNTAYTPHEVAFFVDDARPALVVARPDTLTELDVPVLALDAGAGGGSIAELAASCAPIEHVVERDADDLAALLYTSGTTGRSKGAMLTHRNLSTNARALHDIWRFGPDDVLLHTLPIFHVHGLFVALHCAMLAAAEVVFLPRFDVDEVLDRLPGSTVMMGVPTQYTRLLADERLDAAGCAGMRLFTSGSAPMTEAVHRRFTERTAHRILERYGMTEAGMITSNPYDGPRVPGTVGFPLPDVDLRVVAESGETVATGEHGVVEIRSPGLFAGYWGLPEKTAAEFREGGWFVTGDVGSVDAEGRLTLEGRAGDMIISGGYNVYPKEIELVLDAVPGVRESAVIGVPHPDLGEAVVAIVVPEPAPGSSPGGPADAAALTTVLDGALDGVLARFKHPKRYVVADTLPRNAMSKVQKATLRTQHDDLFS